MRARYIVVLALGGIDCGLFEREGDGHASRIYASRRRFDDIDHTSVLPNGS
jgi:hypothetical protein